MARSDYSEEAETPTRVRLCRGGFQTLPYGPPATHSIEAGAFPTGRPIALTHNGG